MTGAVLSSDIMIFVIFGCRNTAASEWQISGSLGTYGSPLNVHDTHSQ
jgi:hypothetical protein